MARRRRTLFFDRATWGATGAAFEGSFDSGFIHNSQETQLIEQLRYILLYRWFVGVGMSGKVWDRSSFSKNRKRLIEGEIADRFFPLVVTLANNKVLVSSEHFLLMELACGLGKS